MGLQEIWSWRSSSHLVCWYTGCHGGSLTLIQSQSTHCPSCPECWWLMALSSDNRRQDSPSPKVTLPEDSSCPVTSMGDIKVWSLTSGGMSLMAILTMKLCMVEDYRTAGLYCSSTPSLAHACFLHSLTGQVSRGTSPAPGL